MTIEILLRYLHFISIFAIVGALVSEHLLLKKSLSRSEVGRLAKIDGVYGLAVLILLAVGMTLWLGPYGKPTEFYSNNPLFHTKLTLFIIIGILSIYPTVFFIKNKNGDQEENIAVPNIIFWMVRLELLLLFVIPFLAGLMAKGIGIIE
jgi:putative membrane protein